MAKKGRKLTTSHSETLLGSYSYVHGQDMVKDSSELGEDDVWSMVDGMVNGYDNGTCSEWRPRSPSESNGSLSSHRGCRCHPRDEKHGQVGGLSLAFEDPNKTTSPRIVHQFRGQEPQDTTVSPAPVRHMATSAPVNVPDWSKIYRVYSIESLHDSDDGGDDQEAEWVPPHEYLARSRKAAANSVFEGVGRTLKGRDMSRVRDAVWSRTGFNG